MTVKVTKLSDTEPYPYDIKVSGSFYQQMQLDKMELYDLFYQIREIIKNEDENNK